MAITWFDIPSGGMSPGGQIEFDTLSVTKNGTYSKQGKAYTSVTVNVPSPTGKITITENGTDIDIAQYALADVNVEGGGGSSDFSTAEVTISGATGEEATVLLMPNIQDSDRRTGIEAVEVKAFSTQTTYNVPLFKGHCLIKVNSGDVDGLTGNVTLNRGWLDVTGNCSLIGYYVQN